MVTWNTLTMKKWSEASLRCSAWGRVTPSVYPTDGTPLTTSLSAVLKNAPDHNAARSFLEFLMNKEYAQDGPRAAQWNEEPKRRQGDRAQRAGHHQRQEECLRAVA
jgi:ABC-type Fe3+ transport system substrate-binding protein